jgi:hypothetical protein
MSLMGPELIEAWHDPYFICIDRPAIDCYNTMMHVGWGWHPQAIQQIIDIQLRSLAKITFTNARQ